ncbi:MAG: hypothetical protein IPK60_19875 [Sandaracinaceae bacterium]|nr:hypothetical protein [Sandaracinaceae bacterium]
MRLAEGNPASVAALLIVLTVAGACKKREHIAPAPAPRPAPMMRSVQASSAVAFDLVATADGALLVWGPKDTSHGSVIAQRLDALGSEIGGPTVVDARPNRDVRELVAAASAGRLGVGWIEAEGTGVPKTRATFGGARAEVFAPAEDFGDSVAQEGAQRGRLVIAASEDGALTLTHRIPRDDCYARDGVCERYMQHRLGRTRREGPDPMERMEVRDACEPFLYGSVWTNGTWFSGVCSTEEDAMIPVIVVRPAISYAAPNNGPGGCTPLGLVAAPDGAVAVVSCQATRVYRWISLEGRTIAQTSSSSPLIECRGGRMHLRAGDGAVASPNDIGLSLNAPQSRIELMLPTALSGVNARAVWTGASVLVAQESAGALRLSRLRCENDRLVTTNAP